MAAAASTRITVDCFPGKEPGMTGHFGEMTYSMLKLIQGDGSDTLVPLIAELSLCQLFTITKGQCILKSILIQDLERG